MRIITAADIADVLRFRDVIEALRAAFRAPIEAPLRHHHAIARPDAADGALLLMPAWTDFASQGHSHRGFIGIKVVTVTPDNPSRGKPSIAGVYLLMAGNTGAPLAVLDGQALTLWRTAAASALAAGYLAREDSTRLLMVGAGALAPYLVEAHCSVRPIDEVLVWNRSPKAAEKLAAHLNRNGRRVSVTDDLEGAVRGAHIISCATMAEMPLICGAWLAPGSHLDLVGAFTPTMREADDIAIERARLFVDTRAGAMAEAGDIAQPLAAGRITPDDIAADLFDLCRGARAGRRFYNQITLFKSVGTAVEDLAIAELVFLKS